MRKLKNKYKYANRQNHLKAENQSKILADYIVKYGMMFGMGTSLYILNMRHMLPVSDKAFEDIISKLENQINNYDMNFHLEVHWTQEEVEEFNKFKPRGLPLESALEKVDGTTNPSVEESFHSIGDIKITE